MYYLTHLFRKHTFVGPNKTSVDISLAVYKAFPFSFMTYHRVRITLKYQPTNIETDQQLFHGRTIK